MRSQSRLLRVAPLVFGSGFCALVYQTTWLREFRLIFGASTAATAAVLGIFMGAIGVGSAILGRRSESKTHPLKFYGKLELMIAASAAATPILLLIIRHIYLALGGTLTMGVGLGTIVRLFMSTLAIGLPAFLMGGTLPAVARAVTATEDSNRRSVALLYGVNTLGAVIGAIAPTFYLFEAWGNRFTLWAAAALNALVALAALWTSRKMPAIQEEKSRPSRVSVVENAVAPAGLIFAASAIAGFVFLLMELVWYRMLSPLLGGSTFTFGLVLAVALFGIGLGGLIYAWGFGDRRVTLPGFAFVCALEALFIAIPYALGDRIALATMLLRPLGSLGFYGHMLAWTAICAVVILPAAILSGIQFPSLIALLGKGKVHVGSDTGTVYAWNTAGAIIGSLAGGFGLLPALSAPGVWRLVVVLLCGLAGVMAATGLAQRAGGYFRQLPALGTAALALCLLTATGPTAFWRHSQIGVGRMVKFTGSKSDYHDLENAIRRDILWETDGVESSVALSYSHGLNFIVNGRCDGHVEGDKGTQIMMGLVPAALHEKPVRSLVIGLGTGSSAGWLAAIPSMERVDVVELEPSIVRVAEACAPVNHQALQNAKLHVIVGDGREVLLSTRQKYDVIASEPSNPYRAGIASLFTKEFYEAAANRLTPNGLFAQWVQAYEIDASTMETVYATISSVFGNVEIWRTQGNDLLIVASRAPRTYDAEALRRRIAEEPFKSALADAWGAVSLEGFLSHFVANNSLVQAWARVDHARLNTDDHTVLEFAFARTMDPGARFRVATLQEAAEKSGSDRPVLLSGKDKVVWEDVKTGQLSMLLEFGETNPDEYRTDDRSLAAAYASYAAGDLREALALWREQPREVKDLNQLRLVAECLADEDSTEAVGFIDKLRAFAPTEANAILAHLLYRRRQFEAASEVLEKVFVQLRTNPWPNRDLTSRTLLVARRVTDEMHSPPMEERLYQALRLPFSVFNNDEPRRMLLLHLGMKLDGERYGERTMAAVETAEPHVPWQDAFLKIRKSCYQNVGNPRLAQAERELNEFNREQPPLLRDIPFRNPAAPWEPTAGYGLEHQLHPPAKR